MFSRKILWEQTMTVTLESAGVKVDRDEFLEKELEEYCSREQIREIIATTPAKVLSSEKIEELAIECINFHTASVTIVSFFTGLPGGLAMMATIPADILQFYWHILVLSQKLAYIYGYKNLRDESGEFSEASSHLLTIFVGVMLGYGAARNGLDQLARDLAKQIVSNLPEKALMKAGTLPLVKSMSHKIGFNIEKIATSKTLSFIPLLGGALSGGLTYASFHKGAYRLQKVLRERMFMTIDNDILSRNIAASTIKSCNDNLEKINMTTLEILINMAVIDNELDKEERKYIRSFIKKLNVNEEDKIKLLFQLNNLRVVIPDYSYIKGISQYSQTLLLGLSAIAKIGNVVKPEEKEYLCKVAFDLGYENDYVEQLLVSNI